MELRDITREDALLKSYKAVFVDNQKHELLRIYRDHGRRFPIFTERVFLRSSTSPGGFLALTDRGDLDDESPGRLFILERTDNPADASRTRLFWVWVPPRLVAQFAGAAPDARRVNIHVVFHPFGGLDKYPAYWRGGISPLKIPNFLELGARYLCKEKHVVTQHLCAIGPSHGSGVKNGSRDKTSRLPVMVVVPVSSANTFTSLGNPRELQEALEQIARRCYEGVTSRLLDARSLALDRVAVSGYSRSGAVLRSLLDNAKTNERFMRNTLKEIYAFDVMLDEKRNDTVMKTKKEGYDEFWSKLKEWQGDDSDKMIRLYSAEPATVARIYLELQDRLKRYGGGYHNRAVTFSAFNNTRVADGSRRYAGLSDGYEIYSTDNSRSLVVLPSGNSAVYLSSENITNPGGFQPGGDYEPALEGHSWFVSRLLTHALYHSGFWIGRA